MLKPRLTSTNLSDSSISILLNNKLRGTKKFKSAQEQFFTNFKIKIGNLK